MCVPSIIHVCNEQIFVCLCLWQATRGGDICQCCSEAANRTCNKRRGHPHPTPNNNGPKKRLEPAGQAKPRDLFCARSKRTQRRYVSTLRKPFNIIKGNKGRPFAVDTMAAFIEAEGKVTPNSITQLIHHPWIVQKYTLYISTDSSHCHMRVINNASGVHNPWWCRYNTIQYL